jgi:hypothetical protein
MSAELSEFENRLRGRSDDEPTGALRARVISAVTAEMRLQRKSSFFERSDERAWASAAAALLVALYLSMMFAARDAYSISPPHSTGQVTAELRAIRELEAQQEGMFK